MEKILKDIGVIVLFSCYFLLIMIKDLPQIKILYHKFQNTSIELDKSYKYTKYTGIFINLKICII